MKYNKEYYDRCFKACKVSREELGPAELIRYTRLADQAAILSGREYDTLVGLVQHGPLAVGCEPSKAGRSDLIEKGLCVAVVVKGDPSHYAATNDGWEVYRMLLAAREEGAVKAEVVATESSFRTPRPGRVYFQVPSKDLAEYRLKCELPVVYVTDLMELERARHEDEHYIALVGSPLHSNPYSWVLENGTLAVCWDGSVLIDPNGRTLRDKHYACGEVWDPVMYICRVLRNHTQAAELLQEIEPERVLKFAGDARQDLLVDLGVLIPHVDFGYCLSDLGVRVKAMMA